MNEDRNQDRFPKQQTRQKHPDEWQRDLNPNHLAGQNIGPESAATGRAAELTAFHMRKSGMDLRGMDDAGLKQIPALTDGQRLQQGATYVDLYDRPRREFTARGDMSAAPGTAYVAKDRVPYQVWNRLTGEPKPGQERASEDDRPPRS